MSSAGLSIADLKDLVQQDIQDSQQMQSHIDELRTVIAEGRTIPDVHALQDLESKGRKMLKDLIIRIDKIEDQDSLTATDREMLQALNARQVVCDKQIMQIVEFRDLHWQARGKDYYPENPEIIVPEKRLRPGAKARMYRKKPTAAPETASGPSTEGASTPVVEPKKPLGPSMKSVAEPVDPRDIGAAPYATSRDAHATGTVPSENLFEVVYEDEEYEDEGEYEYEEEEEDEETIKAKWPLCYRIMDVDPRTEPHLYEEVCKRAYRSLSLKHEPKRLPNDPEAPARWAAITKEYETLTDPARKQYYDMHGKEPADLQDFGLSTLTISDRR
ncbi:hypothetical protein LTR85_010475 [Meristemomyces frigidus]|nr:hypothetical protein LTR85_010475 [Meristemomyces frigidus]